MPDDQNLAAVTPAAANGFPDTTASIRDQLKQLGDAVLALDAQHHEAASGLPTIDAIQTAVDTELRTRDDKIARLEQQVEQLMKSINDLHALIG